MQIDIGHIRELRERTGHGMMDCRKAMEEAEGDIKLAEELLKRRLKYGFYDTFSWHNG